MAGLADNAVLCAEPEPYGPAASDPVASRTAAALAADPVRVLQAIRAARAAAREQAWALAGAAVPGADCGLVIVELNATLMTSHSEQEYAAPTWPGGRRDSRAVRHGQKLKPPPHAGCRHSFGSSRLSTSAFSQG
jgi:hypothetical protein